MKTKTIFIHEGCEWLYVDGQEEKSITLEQYRKLQLYLQDTYGNLEMLQVKVDRIMFVNYVGFISLEDVYIEILPKVSLCSELDSERARLLEMLAKCNELPVKVNYNDQDIARSSTLLSYFARLFVAELEAQLNRGVHREYIGHTENLPVLKGKIMIADHIRKNHSNRSMVVCRYDEFSENNLMNMLFKAALRILYTSMLCSDLVPGMTRLMGHLSDVEDAYIHPDLLNSIEVNRQNLRFEKALVLAKIVILKLHSKNRYGTEKSFSILFEMNTLYEKYIALLVRKIARDEGFAARVQDKDKYLLRDRATGNKNINLKPDIVVETGDSVTIIDTKWKMIQKGDYLNYVQADIYQMYAYITAYTNAKRCILLYPKVSDDMQYPTWDLMPPYSDRCIQVKDVRLDTESNTYEDLRKLTEHLMQ